MIDKIIKLNPCAEAQQWINKNRHLNAYQLWRKCERGDWLLWLAARLEIDRQFIVMAACECAEQSLKYVPDGEDRPWKAIETARAWCRGEATMEQVRAAYAGAYAAAAYAAYAAYAGAYAAAYAAAAAAAAYAAAADAAADAAANAANAAAANAASRQKSLKHSADLVRKNIPWKLWKAAL